MSTAGLGVKRAPNPAVSRHVRNVETPSGPGCWLLGRPTVRESGTPRREQDAQQANAGGRKATGNHGVLAGTSAGCRDNWPDTRPVAGPERALTWAGEPLNADADQAAGTEGQVGHRMTVNGPEDVLRTGTPSTGGLHEEQRTAAAAEDLQGDAGAGLGQGPVPAEDDAASRSNTLVSVRQVTQRNAGRRTAGIDGQVALTSKARAEMAVRVHHDLRLETRTGQARVCPEGQRKTPPARHSRDHGPLPPGTGPARAGTRVGGPVRAPIVWVPAGSWLRRRDRRAVHHAERQDASGCGS